MSLKIKTGPLVVALIMVGAGCAPIVDTRGNIPDPEALAAIRPGVQTRAQVSALLGSPSNVGTFDDNTWYYITRKTETTAFFAPEPVDEQVVMVTFTDDGVVADVAKQQGLDTVRSIEPVARVTPTAGHSLGLLEQLFGDVGRFTGLPGKKGAGGGGGPGRPGG